jgi:NAD(P)-dependent dehydrogenase (short-subunit alcohol dehydrogenase family)
MPVAIVTGGSRGLGRALARSLASRGWEVIIDARGAADLDSAARALRSELGASARIVPLAGDVNEPGHRGALIEAAARLGQLDLLVNNAGILGPSPQPRLSSYPLDALADVLAANTIAPLAMMQAALPVLRRSGDPRILNITSDAAVEAYDGWGGYGASKAALEALSRVFAVEEPAVRMWLLDPGDMATQMHQEAFPGEDISDRPSPESLVYAVVALIDSDRPSGRYVAADLSGRKAA